MNEINKNSTANKSWQQLMEMLRKMNLNQLLEILRKSSVKVTDEDFIDKPHLPATEQIILLLEEEDIDTLYQIIITSGFLSKK